MRPFWLCLTVAATTLVAQPPLVIKGGQIFDAVQGRMGPNHGIVIEGGRIRGVGAPGQPVRTPRGARVVDAKGKYILPGLIDAHVHLVHVLDFAQVTGDEVLPLFLANGVTSVRDTGDEIVAERLVARIAEQHPERAPRVFLCSPLVDRDPPFHKDIGRAVTDPEQVPAFVADMKKWGVTTLKIYVGTERPVAKRLIEEGHKQGLVVTAHLGRYSAQDAVADGIDSLEHIWSVFNFILPPDAGAKTGVERLRMRGTLDLESAAARDLIAQLVKRRVPVGPNLVVFRNMILLNDLEDVHKHPDHGFVPRRLQDYWNSYRTRSNLTAETRELRAAEFRKYQELTRILHRAGVPILAGTDTAEPYVPPGFSIHTEMELLVEAGLPPASALQSATIENARILKQERNLGSVEVGKLADLVVLDADPLTDIRNTRKIHTVVREGRTVNPQALLKATVGSAGY